MDRHIYYIILPFHLPHIWFSLQLFPPSLKTFIFSMCTLHVDMSCEQFD